jgi:SAM-dependent methyltransferase
MINFLCNVCGANCGVETIDREVPSCKSCGSNTRFRWIVEALSMELFGKSLLLKNFPKRKDIRGLGMSDPDPIPDVLETRFDYINTGYDIEPKLDIMDPPLHAGVAFSGFNFIICSEVFEHVRPPIQTAFNNLARMLKPGGVVIFSVPWGWEGNTVEFFPNMHDWQIVKLQSGRVLVNRTAAGRLETFENLEFHGGAGLTLVMREFSTSGIAANCEAAGFTMTIAEDDLKYGIVWEKWSRGMILRKVR